MAEENTAQQPNAAPNVDENGTLHLPGRAAPVMHSSGLPLAQIQAWNAQEVAAGRMTQAQALAIEQGEEAAPAAPTPAVAPAAPGAAPALNVGQGVEAHLMWEVAHGRLSQEQADAMLGRGDAAAAPVDAAPDEVAAHLTTLGFEPAKPTDFQLPQYLGQNERMTPELQKADATLRGWLSDAYLTKGIGDSIAKQVEQVGAQQAHATDSERKIYARSQVAQLERMWGDKTDEKIQLAQALIRDIEKKRPGLVRLLDETGSGNNAFIIAQIAMAAERIAAGKKK